MADGKVTMRGLEEIERAMRKLPIRVAQRVAQRATNKAAQVILDEATNNALRIYNTYSEGLLAENIKMARGKTRNKLVKMARVGVEGGAKKPEGNTLEAVPYYWRFLEFGTSKMEAKPFLTPAFESKKYQALDILKRELQLGVEREAKKLK